MPVNTLSQWIEICCENTLFLFLPLLFFKFMLSKRYRQNTFKSVKSTVFIWGGMGKWSPSITVGKGCKRVGYPRTGGRTRSIDENPVAPHSTQFEERLWLLSENCDTHTPWTANSICCYCVCACGKVGFPLHSICLQAQAQLQGIQFFI